MASFNMQSCCCFFILALCISASNCAEFTDIFEPSWANDHVMYEGELLKLKLDNFSGISSQPLLISFNYYKVPVMV